MSVLIGTARRTVMLWVVAPTLLLAVLVLNDAPAWLLVPAVVAWIVVVPGLPWALRLQPADAGDIAAVTLAVSLALATLVGGGMAVLAIWSTPGAVLTLAALAALGAFWPIHGPARGDQRTEGSDR